MMVLSAKEAALRLHGQCHGRTVLCPGPGHSRRDRSLSVRLDPNAPDGFLCFSHAADDWQACRDYVRERLGLPRWQPGDEQNRRIPSQHVGKWDLACTDAGADARPFTEDDLLRIKRAEELWSEAGDPRGTLAERYLKSRWLDLPDNLAGSVLRFHPRCPWRDETTGRTDRLPALIAAFRSIDDNQITAVHRIALDANGNKIGRRMLGVVHRAAVKLDPATDSVAIGEGIETAMAARQLGVEAPCWALGSVGAISFFPVLDSVNRLFILGELGEASAQASRLCGRRWQRARRRVTLIRPTVGDDLNDALMAEAGK
jgi:hypothetical protein